MKGASGILWRLAYPYFTEEGVLDGPQGTLDRQRTLLVDGVMYVSDALSIDDEQLICGVYHILQGKLLLEPAPF